MNTPGYQQWFTDRVCVKDGQVGTLTVGQDDQGRKERFQWWSFSPDGGQRVDMMIVTMWAGEPQDEKHSLAKSPYTTIKSVGGHLFTYEKLGTAQGKR